MKRSPVDSKAIKSVGYDEATRCMHVEFSDGGCHEYHGVSAETHKAFMDSPSKGKHFHSLIKPHHKSRKL